ncbi:hypothetical protein C2E23DRAFT_808352 [Lenzites betulinus]|nr:hypothetical protein C2E23DRAFT_808352 [Lenzites betulinus]
MVWLLRCVGSSFCFHSLFSVDLPQRYRISARELPASACRLFKCNTPACYLAESLCARRPQVRLSSISYDIDPKCTVQSRRCRSACISSIQFR